jgi:hypothetical protein
MVIAASERDRLAASDATHDGASAIGHRARLDELVIRQWGSLPALLRDFDQHLAEVLAL